MIIGRSGPARVVFGDFEGKTVQEIVREYLRDDKKYSLIQEENFGAESTRVSLQVLEGIIKKQIQMDPQLFFTVNLHGSMPHMDIVAYYLYEGNPTFAYVCSDEDFVYGSNQKYFDSIYNLGRRVFAGGNDYDIYILRPPNPFGSILNWLHENPLEVKQ
tara:strand:- start:7609 stop:8085 length:477 start_codon:yes stop_codon:yes gene_type:complete